VKYKDFSDEFLVAAYQESRLRPGETLRSGEIIDRYPLTFEPGWVVQLVRDLGVRGYFTSKGVDSDDRGQPIRLTGRGLRVAEELMEKGIGIFRLDLGDGIGFAPAEENSSASVSDATDTASATDPSVDSSSWTGLPSTFQLTDAKRESLVRLLSDTELALDAAGVGNSEKAMARAYIVAAKALADAPEPPADLIWEIINRANQLAGIASLFVSIIALFVSAQ
jgi:hypothetical protein